ncbi:uncharacterized protein LODBEIA_P48740 [Lodderomyces beijingensis]|uniref:Mitochondrial thiamine pyrophosphate carrier 1 n=1 Tax=Lodderomyces beijingensis TaxID=1775926 RepID=A0ABP0ZVW0_9ASCO
MSEVDPIPVIEKEEQLWTDNDNHVPRQPSKYLGFVAGTASGFMKNLVGHPFDTIKVRLQTSSRFTGTLNCLLETLRKEGVSGLYKGFTPPLVGWVLMDATMLGSLHFYRHWLMENVYPDHSQLPLSGHAIAGFGSGMTVSFVAAPVEQIKARLQVQYGAKTRLYTGPIDCLKKVYDSAGIRGIYRGLFATMVFRSNFVFWWSSYEIFKQWFQKSTKMSDPSINFFSGGLSATVFWIFAYPADVVKQTIMTDSPVPSERKLHRYRDAVRYIYDTRGLSGFGRGFLPCILRSFPANAAALAAFEAVMKLFTEGS